MQKTLDRRWFWCLLVLIGAALGASADDLYDFTKLKEAGNKVAKNGDIFLWIPLEGREKMDLDESITYTVVNVPTEAGKPPKRFVLQIGNTAQVRPDSSWTNSWVLSTPMD